MRCRVLKNLWQFDGDAFRWFSWYCNCLGFNGWFSGLMFVFLFHFMQRTLVHIKLNDCIFLQYISKLKGVRVNKQFYCAFYPLCRFHFNKTLLMSVSEKLRFENCNAIDKRMFSHFDLWFRQFIVSYSWHAQLIILFSK